MFSCLVLGDSTGVGTAQAINARYAGRCDVLAVERATADQVRAWRKPAKDYGTCIFAIGSNDAPDGALARKLIAIRRTIATKGSSGCCPTPGPAPTLSTRWQLRSGTRALI